MCYKGSSGGQQNVPTSQINPVLEGAFLLCHKPVVLPAYIAKSVRYKYCKTNIARSCKLDLKPWWSLRTALNSTFSLNWPKLVTAPPGLTCCSKEVDKGAVPASDKTPARQLQTCRACSHDVYNGKCHSSYARFALLAPFMPQSGNWRLGCCLLLGYEQSLSRTHSFGAVHPAWSFHLSLDFLYI